MNLDKLLAKLVARAWVDKDFNSRLMSNPVSALAEFGAEVDNFTSDIVHEPKNVADICFQEHSVFSNLHSCPPTISDLVLELDATTTVALCIKASCCC